MKIVRSEDRICEIIEFEKQKPHIISFVGAGGKTTLIYRLGEELKARGLKVIVTTTTKMYRPEHGYVEWDGMCMQTDGGCQGMYNDCKESIKGFLEEENVVTVGQMLIGGANGRNAGVENGDMCSGMENDGKIVSIPAEDYECLTHLADVLLVEADGSRRMPLKVPADHEPVLFPNTDLVVGVLGMRSIGECILDVSQRPEDVAAFLNTDTEHIVTREDLEAIAESPLGLRKGVDCAFVAVGNQYE